ncbi:hypothetical protein T439DRAFT_359134 [Meredithblackwellia eburnea MCA 4105]
MEVLHAPLSASTRTKGDLGKVVLDIVAKASGVDEDKVVQVGKRCMAYLMRVLGALKQVFGRKKVSQDMLEFGLFALHQFADKPDGDRTPAFNDANLITILELPPDLHALFTLRDGDKDFNTKVWETARLAHIKASWEKKTKNKLAVAEGTKLRVFPTVDAVPIYLKDKVNQLQVLILLLCYAVHKSASNQNGMALVKTPTQAFEFAEWSTEDFVANYVLKCNSLSPEEQLVIVLLELPWGEEAVFKKILDDEAIPSIASRKWEERPAINLTM